MGNFVFNPEFRYADPGEYTLGQELYRGNGDVYLCIKAGAAIPANQLVRVNQGTREGHPAQASNSGIYEQVGIAEKAFTAGQFGFIKVRGTTNVLGIGSAAANRQCYTASSGQIGTTSASQNRIDNVTITGARVAATGLVPVNLNRPYVAS